MQLLSMFSGTQGISRNLLMGPLGWGEGATLRGIEVMAITWITAWGVLYTEKGWFKQVYTEWTLK